MKKIKMNLFFLWFMKITGWLGAVVFFKPKVYYMNRKKHGRHIKGACILMSNHVSLWDFFLYLLVFVERNIRFLMAEILFTKNPFMTYLCYATGGIYVNRDAINMSFLRESLQTLKKGGVVGIFPQGRVAVKGKTWPFKPGVVTIALRSGAPILPVYTDGNYGIFKQTHVMIGEKIYLKDYFDVEDTSEENVRQMTQFLQDKTFELKDEMERRMGK